MPNIRKFRPSDADAVKSLIKSVMEDEFPEDLSAYPMDDLNNIPKHYGNIGEAFFVAEDGHGKIVGTVAVKKDDERHALLRRFFVSPSHRGKKIGQRLLARTIDFCKEVGYQEIVVKATTRMERAIKVCKDGGFLEKGRIDLGGIQIFKLELFLKENSPLATK